MFGDKEKQFVWKPGQTTLLLVFHVVYFHFQEKFSDDEVAEGKGFFRFQTSVQQKITVDQGYPNAKRKK